MSATSAARLIVAALTTVRVTREPKRFPTRRGSPDARCHTPGRADPKPADARLRLWMTNRTADGSATSGSPASSTRIDRRGAAAARSVRSLPRFRLLDRGRPACGRAASDPWHPMGLSGPRDLAAVGPTAVLSWHDISGDPGPRRPARHRPRAGRGAGRRDRLGRTEPSARSDPSGSGKAYRMASAARIHGEGRGSILGRAGRVDRQHHRCHAGCRRGDDRRRHCRRAGERHRRRT